MQIINALDKDSRTILEKIVHKVKVIDPFDIKKVIIDTLESGETSLLSKLQLELEHYIIIFNNKLNNLFATLLNENDLRNMFNEYS